MNTKLENYKKFIKDKKVAVLGMGISNIPLIKYLASLGTCITAFDQSEESEFKQALKELEGLDVRYCLGKKYLEHLKGFDIVFKTPKIRFDIPELIAEKERGAIITSEMELFCELCPARIFAITGSDGKTTTTTIIYKMLVEGGYKCWLGGNIGAPLIDKIDEITESDMVVLELSSFQLHTMKNRLNTVVVTNVSPNHLDVHKSMEEYIDAKKNIFRYQDNKDLLVVNYDNEITRTFAQEAKGKTVFFSRVNPIDTGMIVEDGSIFKKNGNTKSFIMNTNDIRLPGLHNVENYLAAAAAVIDFVKPEVIKKIAATFNGVEHRNEFVREFNGIKFYNDSIGSSPTRTIATVKSFNQKVILITGGYDKHIPYDDLGGILTENVKCLVLIGQTAPIIEDVLKKETQNKGMDIITPSYQCKSLAEAVEKAYECAEKDDIILLSPASASFDMFKNFEERGNIYKELVNNIS